jgi:hypothetical protein
MDRTNYWIPVEEQWQERNLPLLREHLDCASRAHAWIARLATHEDIVRTPVSEMLGVSRLLLRRLGEELRAVEILALSGHGFQAATAACNLFEQSHYLTYVGISLENAKKFIEWTELHKSIVRIIDLVNASGVARGWNKDRCDDEYGKYRFLCGFKHNNPVFQRILTLPSDPDLYMSQYALAESIWSCSTAIGLFAVQFLEVEHLNEFLDELNPIMEEARNLFPVAPTKL